MEGATAGWLPRQQELGEGGRRTEGRRRRRRRQEQEEEEEEEEAERERKREVRVI